MILRFSKPIRGAKRRAQEVADHVGDYAYTYALVGDRKYEVRCWPDHRRARITPADQ